MLAGTGRDDLTVLGLHAISAAGRHVSHRRRSPITSGLRSEPPAIWWTCRSVGAVPIVASTPTTVDALSRGVTQVVAVGAGYDGRAPRYRMPGYDGGRELASYVPPAPPEAVAFAADCREIPQRGRGLEEAEAPHRDRRFIGSPA